MESGSRLRSVDALRGAVMVIMALDHVRDFFHVGAMSFAADDLTKTTAALFFTRWITHFCAPTFMFAAGMGAFLWRQHAHTNRELSRFLLTRGLWLVLLEVTVMRLALNFSVSFRYPILLLVLWALGMSMIALAALVHLPARWLAVFSVAVIALHNCLDGIRGSGLWNVIHQPGAIVYHGIVVVVGYPLIPWIAVMSAGFCFGQVLLLEPATRRRILMRTGLALTVAFLVIRALNIYGNPVPWSTQNSGVFTMLSFLNCTKYPPSLDFLLMTLGPSLVALAWFDQLRLSATNPLVVLGRVPLFYFVVHFYVIHTAVVLAALLRYGTVWSLAVDGRIAEVISAGIRI